MKNGAACQLFLLLRGLSISTRHLSQSDWDGDIIPQCFTTVPTIINVMLWVKKEAYEETTIKATAKRRALRFKLD